MKTNATLTEKITPFKLIGGFAILLNCFCFDSRSLFGPHPISPGLGFSCDLSISQPLHGKIVTKPEGTVFTHGTAIQLTAIPKSGYQFFCWNFGDTNYRNSVHGNPYGKTAFQNPDTLTITGNTTVSAEFVKEITTLSISSSTGGQISRSPDQSIFRKDDTASLLAIPDYGYAFIGWDNNPTATDMLRPVVMDTDKSIFAQFSPVTPARPSFNDSMVLIPGGTFRMGFEPNSVVPGQKLADTTVGSFYMSATECTQFKYRDIIGKNPSCSRSRNNDNRPVDSASWIDAVLFCNAMSKLENLDTAYTYYVDPRTNERKYFHIDYTKKGYRLPTTAEWEYACKAGTHTANYWGDGALNDNAWYRYNSHLTTLPVGSRTKNAFGLYDMIDNVFEWCNDEYDCSRCHIIHGGSIFSYPSDLSSNIIAWKSDIDYDKVGFRVILPVTP